MVLRITKQSAQGYQGKVIWPYTIGSRSASRHHTDSLGANTAKKKGSEGHSSSASRLLGRYMTLPPLFYWGCSLENYFLRDSLIVR